MMRVNHDYHRRGAVAYLAAYDVHRAKVYGRCEDTTGIVPFTRLVEQVMTQEPYKSADRVFWVVDNGSSHRGQTAIDRLAEQFPNAVMVHTPVHASWLNQVEIFFSITQRKVAIPQRLRRSRRRHRPARRIRNTLQPGRETVQVEVHHHRPGRPPGPTRPPPAGDHHRPSTTPRRLTPDELTGETT